MGAYSASGLCGGLDMFKCGAACLAGAGGRGVPCFQEGSGQMLHADVAAMTALCNGPVGVKCCECADTCVAD